MSDDNVLGLLPRLDVRTVRRASRRDPPHRSAAVRCPTGSIARVVVEQLPDRRGRSPRRLAWHRSDRAPRARSCRWRDVSRCAPLRRAPSATTWTQIVVVGLGSWAGATGRLRGDRHSCCPPHRATGRNRWHRPAIRRRARPQAGAQHRSRCRIAVRVGAGVEPSPATCRHRPPARRRGIWTSGMFAIA